MALCMLACLAGMGAVQAEEVLCISAEDYAMLITADGREVTLTDQWDRIFMLNDGLCALGRKTDEGMRYALGDSTGMLRTEAEYEMLSMSENVVLFRHGGRYGAMDIDGNWLVKPEYTQLIAVENGFLAMTDDPFDQDADEIFRITPQGELLGTGVSSDEGLSELSDNRMPFQNPANELYGYIDKSGQVVIEPRFETAGCFEGGMAIAAEAGFLGIIDTKGEWMIDPEYNYLEIGDDVIVGSIGRERAVVFDLNCSERFCVEGTGIEAAVVGGYPVILENDVLRIYTAQGDQLYETAPQTSVSAGLDGQLILSDGDWGSECVFLMNPQGVCAERRDQHLIPLADGRYAFIRMNVAAYYSEALDEIRYSCDYDSLRCGMIDSMGNEILPAEYTEIRALGANRFLTIAQDGLRVVDGDGAVIWAKIGEE